MPRPEVVQVGLGITIPPNRVSYLLENQLWNLQIPCIPCWLITEIQASGLSTPISLTQNRFLSEYEANSGKIQTDHLASLLNEDVSDETAPYADATTIEK